MAKPMKFYQTLNQPSRSMKNHGKHRRTSPPAYGSPIVGTDPSTRGSDKDIASPLPEPKPPAIPHAGIRTGELIGYRLWWVIGESLCSLAHLRFWLPNETIVGDTLKPVTPLRDFQPRNLGRHLRVL